MDCFFSEFLETKWLRVNPSSGDFDISLPTISCIVRGTNH